MDLRTTVIMKTDMRDSSKRMSSLTESDLRTLLQTQKQLILEVAGRYGGSAVKGEGDAFWITFPSATGAALAAVAMQRELLQTQIGKGNDTRIAVRIAITLGDVLHEEKDIFGDAVNLAARIESITPPDEIYLSAAAWAALNHAEVRTSFVEEFMLKSFDVPVEVYRVDQEHRTRILAGQVVVVTDLQGFVASISTDPPPMTDVERILESFLLLHNRVCVDFGGVSRANMHDSYILTFPDAASAVAAGRLLCQEWEQFLSTHQYPYKIRVGIHKGDLYVFRSFLYGPTILAALRLELLVKQLLPGASGMMVSQAIRDLLDGTEWENQLQQLEPPETFKEWLGSVYTLA